MTERHWVYLGIFKRPLRVQAYPSEFWKTKEDGGMGAAQASC